MNNKLQEMYDNIDKFEDYLNAWINMGIIPKHLIETAKEASDWIGMLREAIQDEIFDPMPQNSNLPEVE